MNGRKGMFWLSDVLFPIIILLVLIALLIPAVNTAREALIRSQNTENSETEESRSRN